MATTETRRGFDVLCLRCGERGDVRIMLADVTAFYCSNCKGKWSLAEAEVSVRDWQRVLIWIGTAPVREES